MEQVDSKHTPASNHSQTSSLGGQKASSQHVQPHPEQQNNMAIRK